ncbi:MAG: hypothetical protein AMXMBFR84_25310 [Candidatus Hydrogenedentota bacterium]
MNDWICTKVRIQSAAETYTLDLAPEMNHLPTSVDFHARKDLPAPPSVRHHNGDMLGMPAC